MAKTNRISPWIFPLFIRVILYRQIESFQVYHSGSMTSKVQDHVCRNDDVIKSIETASEQQCGFLCTVDQVCSSFFYHPGHHSCVLCGESYLDTTSLESYPGMVYFNPNKVPGVWNDWVSWTACSQSCEGGRRSRNRTCDMNTFGIYTDDCLGHSYEEEESCNPFSCTPLATTCADWASRGLNETVNADIDPDGAGTTFSPLSVSCDFELVPGQAVTVIHHDQEARTHVDNYEACASYNVTLNYLDLPILGFEAAKLIADLSIHCKQYLKWECFHSEYSDPDVNQTCTYWTNRNMEISKYLTGTRSAMKFCACGQSGVENVTCSGQHGCYCSNNDAVWRYDDGYITEKQDLPIYTFNAGDTGINAINDIVDEEGYHTIGPLLCW